MDNLSRYSRKIQQPLKFFKMSNLLERARNRVRTIVEILETEEKANKFKKHGYVFGRKIVFFSDDLAVFLDFSDFAPMVDIASKSGIHWFNKEMQNAKGRIIDGEVFRQLKIKDVVNINFTTGGVELKYEDGEEIFYPYIDIDSETRPNISYMFGTKYMSDDAEIDWDNFFQDYRRLEHPKVPTFSLENLTEAYKYLGVDKSETLVVMDFPDSATLKEGHPYLVFSPNDVWDYSNQRRAFALLKPTNFEYSEFRELIQN